MRYLKLNAQHTLRIQGMVNLNGKRSNVVTNTSGTVVQTLDYYPYGATRISTGQNAEARQFIGQFTDQSNLSYLNARYYNQSQGQFISQDRTFLALGDPDRLKELSQQDQQKVLRDPQQ